MVLNFNLMQRFQKVGVERCEAAETVKMKMKVKKHSLTMSEDDEQGQSRK